jgi:hypothetical protein
LPDRVNRATSDSSRYVDTRKSGLTHSRALHHVLVHHRHGVGIESAHSTHAAHPSVGPKVLVEPAALCYSKVLRLNARATGLSFLDLDLVSSQGLFRVPHCTARSLQGAACCVASCVVRAGPVDVVLHCTHPHPPPTHLLALQLDPTRIHRATNTILIRKRRERKTLAPPRLTIKHHCRIHDLPELGEEDFEAVRGDARGKASDEDLGCALVLCARDRSLGVDLGYP